MRIPEISYVAIGFVARFPILIPVLATLGVAAALLMCLGEIGPLAITAIVAASALTALLTRLFVEIVVVLADTLLPR